MMTPIPSAPARTDRVIRSLIMMSIMAPVALLIGCGAQAKGKTMSLEETNKAAIRRIIEDAVNTGDLAALRAALAPGYRRHSQATLDSPEIEGPDQMVEFVRAHLTAFPDWHEEIELMIAEGDKVALVTRGTGTQTGPMGDIPATGRRIEVMNYIIQRFENEKVAETWIGWDNLSVLMQLGLYPPAAEAAAAPLPGDR
jgi:predicted ester cyclase